jgi:hypothetical protein
MAIDLMVMPLSRYWSGDFVSPAMETAWSLGVAYTVLGPSGARTIPEGEPFGGPGARAKRASLLAEMPERMREIGVDSRGWNERNDDAPYFARIDPRSMESMMADAIRNLDVEPGFFDRLRGVAPRRSHLAHAVVLLPHVHDRIETHEGVAIGSLPRVQTELDEVIWSPASDDAVREWRAAVAEATRRRLPLVVDS